MVILRPFLPIICIVVGLVVYALAANPKAAELGRVTFLCGLLALLFKWPA